VADEGIRYNENGVILRGTIEGRFGRMSLIISKININRGVYECSDDK
jgi:hypothetical protein